MKTFTKKDILTIPNFMSFFRLLMVPFIIFFYLNFENKIYAIILILVSGATDILDGIIARKFNMVSNFGKIIDPLADKVTQGTLILCLISKFDLMWLVIGLFIFREIVMVVLGTFAIKFTGKVGSARWYGKAATVVLETSIMVLILFSDYFSEGLCNGIMYACCGAILAAMALYVWYYEKILIGEFSERLTTDTYLLIWKIIVALMWIGVIVFCLFYKDQISLETLKNHMPKHFVGGAVFMILLFAFKPLSMVLYSGLLFAVSGAFFSLRDALVINVIGVFVMVVVAYFLGNKFSSRNSIIEAGNSPLVERVKEGKRKGIFTISFLMRITRVFPGDMVGMYMGASNVNFLKYFLGSSLGLLPSVVTFTVMGNNIFDMSSPLFIGAACAELAISLISTLIYLITEKGKDIKQER